MKKILIVTGTRPEIIKMSPIIQEAQRDPEIELTHADSSQHFDHNMNRQFFQDLDLSYPHYILSLERKNEISQISSIFGQLAQIIEKIKPDIVLAQGDTNTVMVAALLTKRLGYPFGHVEAGLRSFDLNMPEEINRRIADICSSIHFCPTHLSGLNLLFEGIEPQRIFITGNTIVDAVGNVRNVIKNRKTNSKIGSSNFPKTILLTLHRPSNVDNPRNLELLLESFESLPDYQFVLPIHPRTSKSLKRFSLFERFNKIDNIKIIEPLGYLDFISLLLTVDLVVTDSGGVQEECYCLGKKCMTLRTNTERPETLTSGLNKLVNLNKIEIRETIIEMISLRDDPEMPILLGIGNSSETIIKIIKDLTVNDLNFLSPKLLNWQDYQYKLEAIPEKIKLIDYQKKVNRRILLIFNESGEPLLPNTDLMLKKKFKIVTSRIFENGFS